MKKTVLTFGLISGAIMTAMMFGTLPFTNSAWLQAHSMVIGYTTMVLSFMLVFFGIRSYRENIGGGTITFGRAFAVGILITLISSVLYVVAWEIMYFGVPRFGERFMTMCVAHIKNSGASPEAIQTELNQLKYLNNPFINAAMTFTEPFPVGLIITLISALILRKKIDRNVGLCQGMFDKNILTFNPGWTSDAQPYFDLEFGGSIPGNDKERLIG